VKKTLGVILIVLGVFALAWGGFTYTTKEKVVDIGPIHAIATRHITYRCLPLQGQRRWLVAFFYW
jgi:hypothetical protein